MLPQEAHPEIFQSGQPAPGNRRMHRAWAMYDWANSAYNLVITSTIFPAYYEGITSVKQDGKVLHDEVSFFGMTMKNSALFDYSIAAAYLIVALLSPVLAAIADTRGNKKSYLRFFTFLGGLACCGLYFFRIQTLELGIILAAVAALGYCGGLVFYNSYLPEIAAPEERDRVSAMGFARGYIGSVLLQIVCFALVLKPEWFGWLGIADGEDAARVSFVMVGLWWMIWAQIPFRKLPAGRPSQRGHSRANPVVAGFAALRSVWRQASHMPRLKTFLGAYFCYNMGVGTVMLAATIFGSKVLGLSATQLIATILIIQLVAIAGAYLIAALSRRFGNLQTLFGVVVVWIGVCVAAYFTESANQFYALATVVGLVMGGIQSLSRSTYSKLIPETHDTTSFFSFYDVMEKMSIVLGMVSFGFIEEITGTMRNSVLALMIFFIFGGILLLIAMRKPISKGTATFVIP